MTYKELETLTIKMKASLLKIEAEMLYVSGFGSIFLILIRNKNKNIDVQYVWIMRKIRSSNHVDI